MAYNTALRMTLLLLFAGYICQLSTGAEDTQTCDADHTIITRAVYDDSHHSGPQPLNSTDLLQVYDVCLPRTPRQVSNLQCAGFNFDAESECVGGVHHDPCYWLETNVQNITLRRHWKMAATLPPESTQPSVFMCKCVVSSAVSQDFDLTAVNLYDKNSTDTSRITVLAKPAWKFIVLNSMEPFPKPEPVKASKTLVVKFENGLNQALQILTIKAANARVNVSCEGSNHFATTLPSDLHDVTSDTLPPSADVTTSGMSRPDGESTSRSTTTDEPSPGVPLVTGVVLPACMGGILILVLAVLMRVEMTRRRLAGRSRSLPPPPPPPHVFRRPEPDAVAFHIQPDVQDGRVSFLSVHDHTYEVMPGEESTTSEDTFHASYSSPESNSTTSDDSILHIACPSTDSSLPEDYLHPVASADEAPSKPEMTGEGESTTEHNGYNTKSAWDDPPYENVGNTS